MQILEQLQLPALSILLTDDFIARTRQPHHLMPAGHQLGPRELLFTRISDEEVDQHRTRFSGGLLRHEIWKYYQSTSQAHEQVLQNLKVCCSRY